MNATNTVRQKLLTVFGALLVFTAFGAAHAGHAEHLDTGPGWVTPDSALYGLETAWDNAMMGIGLQNRGDVAQERAAEAREMAAKNDTEAMQKAVDQMNSIAEKASSDDTEGLEKAAAVLQELMDGAPQQAQQGLQTALDNIQNASAQIPDQAGPGAGQAPNISAQIAEARDLREQGRQAVQRGDNLLDLGNNSEAKQAFTNAEQLFTQAESRLEGIRTTEATELRNQLVSSQSGAENLQQSVQAYMDGDNQTAQQEAQNAQEDFEQASQGGSPR